MVLLSCRRSPTGMVWLAATLAVASWGRPSHAQDPKDYFRANCKSCHTIGGGPLVGPDLRGVLERAPSREWLVGFLVDPPGVLAGGDPYAAQIFEQARRIPMPAAPGMNAALAERLLDMIAEEGAKEASEFKGLQISSEPFTAADVDQGRALFAGTARLTAGGAACIACHATYDAPALGGGRLGPDLTHVYDRMQGRDKLANWLSAPATPTMQPAFRNHPLQPDEIHALVAYFEDAATRPVEDATGGRVMFLVLGLAGATVLMFGFDAAWSWRFRGVRQTLVQTSKRRGGR
jgi:cytochrome c2